MNRKGAVRGNLLGKFRADSSLEIPYYTDLGQVGKTYPCRTPIQIKTHHHDHYSAARQNIKTPFQALPILGMNLRATPLLHQRLPVGCGPSLKTWPWCPPQRAQ